MIFDSQEQKDRLLDLIGEVPVKTTIKGILSGPSPELRDLIARMNNAAILSEADQQGLILLTADRRLASL